VSDFKMINGSQALKPIAALIISACYGTYIHECM
jgi:hypothetical protein